MRRSQIEIDLNKWSEQKLNQWLEDSIQRYAIAELDPHIAVANLVAALMLSLTVIVARTNVPADEVGNQLAACIKHVRSKEKKQQ